MRIKTILFDMDGVLLDTSEAIWKTHALTAQKLGLKPATKKQIYQAIGMSWDELISKLYPEANVEKFKKVATEIMKTTYKSVKLIGNATQTLRELKKRGFRLALVSGSHKKYAVEQLKRAGFDLSLLDIMVNGEDTIKHKPDPDPILFALKKLNAKPEETIYIGDSLLDYRAAKSAGVHFIGTLSGVCSLNDFLESGVLYVIDSIGELLKHFDKGELMFERRSVAAFIEYNGKLLLLKRSDKVATDKGEWSTVHGRVEDGESPEKRALKEIAEETGLKVKLVKKGKVMKVKNHTLGISWNFYPFLFKAVSHDVKLNWEHTDFVWVELKDIVRYNKYFRNYMNFLKEAMGDK